MRSTLRLFSRAFVIAMVWGGLAPSPGLASPNDPALWEVAVIFLGAGESPEYQKDIDQNLLELARVAGTGEGLRVGILREFTDRSVEFHPNPTSQELNLWAPLFANAPDVNVPVAGRLTTIPSGPSTRPIFRDARRLEAFFQSVYKDAGAKRLLIVYGHGLGPDGLQVVRLRDLAQRLKTAIPNRIVKAAAEQQQGPGAPLLEPQSIEGPKLDVLWLDACFMSNIEALYGLRETARYILASEEAEFSAGMPFEALDRIAPLDALAGSRELAFAYLDSYSYTRLGSQRRSVFRSSATLSLIDTSRLQGLVDAVKSLREGLGTLTPDFKESLNTSAERRQMDRPQLADLGSLVRAIKLRSDVSDAVKERAGAIETRLELSKPGRQRTQIRVQVDPPRPHVLAVFGYGLWTSGYQGDNDLLDRLPEKLRSSLFVAGPGGHRWPARKVNRHFTATPFTVGQDTFHLYFADPTTQERIGQELTFSRTQDLSIFEAETELNPVLFTGYTHGVGVHAERYSGVSIFDPSEGTAPSLEYLSGPFHKLTLWGDL